MVLRLIFLAAAAYAFGSNAVVGDHPVNMTIPYKKPTKDTRIAFIGDQGLTADSKAVLRMIKDWQADVTVHAGDFDYADLPAAFMGQMQDVFGNDYPYLAVVGNHDLYQWKQYRESLEKQQRASGIDCHGEYGVQMTCVHGGVLMVFSGIGTLGSKHAAYLDKALSQNSHVPFKVCVWHKNQHMYQLGTKPDETGNEVYDVCRRHGAIVATAHEHSYARTHLMSNYAKVKVAPFKDTLHVKPGYSFAFVSGLGGRSIRPYRSSVPREVHWAAYAARQNKAQHGALLCTFGQDHSGECMFKDIDGKIWDQFKFTSQAGAFVPAAYRPFLGRDLDIQVSNQHNIVLVAGDGTSYCNPYVVDLSPSTGLTFQQEYELEDPSKLVVEFQNVSLTGKVKNAYLQLYATKQGVGNMDVNIHSYQGQVNCQDRPFAYQPFLASNASVKWEDNGQGDRDGWESNEVWSSPDLSSIIKNVQNSTSVTLVLVLNTAGGEHIVSGYGSDGKYAPAILIEFE